MIRLGILVVTLILVTGCPKSDAKKAEQEEKEQEKACRRAKNRAEGPDVAQVSTLRIPGFGKSVSLFNFFQHNSNNSRVNDMTFSLRSVSPGFSASIRGGNLTVKAEGGADPDGRAPQGTVEIEAKDSCGVTSNVSLPVKGSASGGSELFSGFGGPPRGTSAQSGTELVSAPDADVSLVPPPARTHRF